MEKNHIILDMWGCSFDSQTAELVGMQFMRTAAKRAGATTLFENSHKFGEEGNLYGYTGIIGLSESHISIHTWPEEDFVAIDIFMCGHSDVDTALEHLTKAFNPVKVKVTRLSRGVDNE